MTTHLLKVRGFDVEVSKHEADGGDSVPLLLFGGVGGQYTHWKSFRRALNRTTIAFDVRAGYLGVRPSLRHFARFVDGVLSELDVDVVDVLGLSWGGMAAQQFARDCPGRVRRLVLASTTPGFVSMPARPSSTLALLKPSRKADHVQRIVTKIYGGDFISNPGLATKLGLIRPIDARAYRQQMAATFGWTSTPWLHRIRKPTLIIHGTGDPVCPFVNAYLMRSLISTARLHKVAGGGHLYLYTRPEATAQVVDAFLDEPSVVHVPRLLGHRAAEG